MEKLLALFSLFRKGQAVKDPAAWKNGTIAVNSVAAFLSALYAVGVSFGVHLPAFTDENMSVVAGSIIAVVAAINSVMHVVTSTKVGVGSVPAGVETDNNSGPQSSIPGH
jgi:hypothetical protein